MFEIFSGFKIPSDYVSKLGKRKRKNRSHLVTFSRKGELYVIVVQQRQRNVQKIVMHVQSCCFANLNLLFFCRFDCRRRRHCF